MNDEEEVVVSEQEQPEQIERKPRKSVSQHVEDFRQGMDDVGKTIEYVGKGQEKLGNMIDGSGKAGNTAADATSAVATVADAGAKGLDAAGKAKVAAGNTAIAAGETTMAAGNVTKTAGKIGEGISKGVQGVGEGVSAAGNSPYTAAAKPVGEGIKTGGKVGEGVSKGTQAAGDTTIAAGKAEKNLGEAQKAAGEAEQAVAKATETAAASTKAGSETVKKASDKTLADKLRERGKLNQIRGKRIQEQAKKFDSDKYFDEFFAKLGKGGKLLKGIIKAFSPETIGVVFLLIITFLTIVVSYIMSPMFFMDQVTNNLKVNPDDIEKVSNFVGGLGFQDSESAFYEEVNYLNTHYGKEIDFPYIMSALYYTDFTTLENNYYGAKDKDSFCKSFNLLSDEGKKQCSNMQVGVNFAQYFLANFVKESTTTTSEDGLVYSANKLYRLRELVKHQMKGDQLKTVDLLTYIKLCKERMGNEVGNIMKDIPLLILYLYAFHDPIAQGLIKNIDRLELLKDITGIFAGTENWSSIELYMKNGKYGDKGFITDLNYLLETFFNCFFKIEGISIDTNFNVIGSLITSVISSAGNGDGEGINWGEKIKESLASLITINITYYDYAYNEVAFEDYLVNDYIVNMPEFQKLLLGDEGKKLTGDALNERALKIGYEIRNLKLIFDNIYKKDESAEENGKCIGNIDLDLLDELQPPVDLTEGQTITFSGTNNYGLYKGMVHNGVDLEDTSTATKKGANVYSIYNGKVVESTADETLSDKTVKGGWLVIDYSVQYNDPEDSDDGVIAQMFKNTISYIRVYYGGMDPQTVKLKKNDTVRKGQVIGKVGDASDSENGTKASLHFAIYDMRTMAFLNPINMFITCRASSDKMCGSNNEQKIWTFLMSKGYTKEAAAGIMGVWQRESSFKPYIVQSHTDSYSKDYTAKIDNGTITKNKFAKDGPGGGGYGLAQWTYYTRKEKLYDFAKEKGKSIGSLEVQLEFFEKEINSDKFKGVKSKLNDKKTVEGATEYFLTGPYQGGTKASLKERVNNAKEIYNKYKDFECK